MKIYEFINNFNWFLNILKRFYLEYKTEIRLGTLSLADYDLQPSFSFCGY